jgi:hypothetical protein
MYILMSGYILDEEQSTSTTTDTSGSNVVVLAPLQIGNTPGNTYVFPTSPAPGANYTLTDVTGTGELGWASISVGSSGFVFKFLTDAGTNYDLLDDDTGVEVRSDTYNTITLPLAVNNNGHIYIISRGDTTNNALAVITQGGDTIDGEITYPLQDARSRIQLISNGLDSWYAF